MKIAMIGDSNAGKTTYMAMMYESMVKGFKNFRLAAKDAEYGAELLATAVDIRKSRYPEPTSQRSRYDFDLSQKKQVFFDFSWSDYRGGALLDRATEGDAKELHADLRAADGIIVFADAARFADDPGVRRHARRLTAACEWAAAERTQKTPVVVAYTKADTVRDRGAWARAMEPLSALHSILDDAPGVHSVTVRVSCGRRPKNVHIPVLWCLSHHIIDRVDELAEDRRRYTARAEELMAGASLGNSWRSWLNSTESEAKKSREQSRRAEQAYREMLPLQDPARDLEKLIRRHLDQK